MRVLDRKPLTNTNNQVLIATKKKYLKLKNGIRFTRFQLSLYIFA